MPFTVFGVALEKLVGLAPLVLFAGGDEHPGKGEKDGNNLGLHVGADRLASLPAGARRRWRPEALKTRRGTHTGRSVSRGSQSRTAPAVAEPACARATRP